MLNLAKKLLANDKVRYLVAGGCTTFVNLIAFFLLRNLTTLSRNLSNVIAIIMAITFAYFANKFFVFRSKNNSVSATILEAVSFFGARVVSMAVEVLGFAILCDSFRLSEVLSKFLVQFVVLVLNYLFSKLFVFKKERRSLKENFKDNYCYYISFGIVFIFMTGVWIAMKITPLAPNSLTIVDSLHQYIPFFSEYRDKLMNEGSLFYSWNIALGSNFVSLAAYYLSSPFNYALLLFSKELIPMVASLLMVIKICLSSTTMVCYLSNKDGEKVRSSYIIAISVCYALSNYVLGYYWNTMWLDCIMIFPLIILGFQKLMKDGDPKMYTLSLFYCLYCNYYIGFIICLFLVLWFFVYNHGGIKKFFVGGIRFGIYSLLSGGLAAFLLIPAYFGIMTTASSAMKLPESNWYGGIFEMFKQMFFMTEPITTQTFDGGVNLYCGTFTLIAIVLYVFSDHIKLWDKIRNILLIGFLFVSFNNELLNYIWHGMHNQYGIPNRFSFLFVFIALVMTYDVLKDIHRMHMAYILSAIMMVACFLVLCDMKTIGGIDGKIMASTIAMLALYAIILIFLSARVMKKEIFYIVFTAVCVTEALVNGAFGMGSNGYASLEKYESTPEVTAAYNKVKEIAKENNLDFHRVELVDSKILDEVTWFNMPSVGTFCSTVNGELVTTMGRLGFYTGANEFLYMGSTPFTNSILNVRYILEREGDYNNFDFNYVGEEAGIRIYENPYPLSLGFAVSEDVKDWDRKAGLTATNQTNLIEKMTGQESCFEMEYARLMVDSDTCDISVNGSIISFTPYNTGEASFITSFYVDHGGDYYVNCRGNGITNVRFYVDGKELTCDRYQSQLFHLGDLQAGQYVAVEYIYRSVTPTKTTATFYMYSYDEYKYQIIHEALNNNMLQVEEYDDGYVYGHINMPSFKTMFTSIPYDEGWTIKVDGKEVPYYAIGEAFIGVDMAPGEHTIEMMYVPKGLKEGLVITLVCGVLFLLGIINYNKKKICANHVKNDVNNIDQESNI